MHSLALDLITFADHYQLRSMEKIIQSLFLPTFALSLLCFSSIKSFAQETPITIKVINLKKEPVTFASIKITLHPDTLKVQQQVADSNGVAIFNLVKGGRYNVSISAINYQGIEKRDYHFWWSIGFHIYSGTTTQVIAGCRGYFTKTTDEAGR